VRTSASVIEEAAPEGPLALVGHSMGGMTTMALGAMRPDLVRDRVVAFGAISTSAGGTPLASGRFAAAMGRLLIERLGPGVAGIFEHRPELLKNLLSANSELAEFLVERYSFASPVPRSVVKLTAKMLLGTNLTVLHSFTPAFDEYDQTAGLVAFEGCETLVFNGEQDLVTPPEHSEAIVRALPGAQHVILRDAGHVIMLEHPDLLTSSSTRSSSEPAAGPRSRSRPSWARGSAGSSPTSTRSAGSSAASNGWTGSGVGVGQPSHPGAAPRCLVSSARLPAALTLASAEDTLDFVCGWAGCCGPVTSCPDGGLGAGRRR
jgi:pimeloyl-ACP methyl ester carboxylesterase